MKLPQIRIKDGWLLRENASQYLHEIWGEGSPLADDEWMEKRVESYRKEWEKYEPNILPTLQEITGLKFSQNIIDVYIAPWFRAFSDPLVIGVTQEPDQFVDTLTHELIHRLLTDNTNVPHDTEFVPIWQKLFGKDHSFTILVHIPVHAIHKYIYLDILDDPKRLERDIKENEDNEAVDYVASWNYVEKNDYKKIIYSLKESYNGG